MNKFKQFIKIHTEILKKSGYLFFTLFVLLACGHTFGWYVKNDNVNATGMKVRIESPSIVNATINIYPVKEINEDKTVYTYVEDEFFDGSLPAFDTSNIMSSIYMKAIVLDLCITTSEENLNVDILLNYSDIWRGTIASMDQDPLEKEGYLNSLSNVVQFRKVASIDNKACTIEPTVYSFVNGDLSSPTKSDISLTSLNLDNNGENHIYLIMEYGTQLIKHFCDLSVNVSYSNDIGFTIKKGDEA